MAKQKKPEAWQVHNVDWMVKHISKIIDTELSEYGRNSTWQVFDDLMDIIAITISNNLAVFNNEKEKHFQEHYQKRYSPDWMKKASEVMALISMFFESGSREDLLGRVFHNLELHNKYRGQFFTPYHVSYLMAQINLSDAKRYISKNGFISIYEPTCGAGGMVIACAQALEEMHVDVPTQTVVVAQDIDRRAVRMTYIQASACCIPCVVRQGNSLANTFEEQWFTPTFCRYDGLSKLRNDTSRRKRRL